MSQSFIETNAPRIVRVETAHAVRHGHRSYVAVVVDQNGKTDMVAGTERDTKDGAHAEAREISRFLKVPLGISPRTYTLV